MTSNPAGDSLPGSSGTRAPPAYTSEGQSVTQEQADAAAAAFSSLNLSTEPSGPTPDTCLAHLRLLFAFQELKNAVGNRDGLWDIWDSRAQNRSANDANRDPRNVLAILREKRWAVFVARAVDRYEAWWQSFVATMLKESDMLRSEGEEKSARYLGFTASEPMIWTADTLPPIDVLLVWHAHMLNPRLYFEDCLRFGQGNRWAAGMPWPLINAAIGSTFKYNVSQNCKNNWTERTGRAWANQEDPAEKELRCPACSLPLLVPWTTCGQPQDYKGVRRPGVAGEGYGDGKLSLSCTDCNTHIDQDVLRVAKFRNDAMNLVKNNWTMPGTVMHVKTGLMTETLDPEDDQLFPNRLVRKGLLAQVVDMIKIGPDNRPNITGIRDMIETITGSHTDSKALKNVDSRDGIRAFAPHSISREARIQVRKMMSRYWENSSALALDLVGAVMRQGVFTEKMYKVGWLHHPASGGIMARLITKYERFVEIIGANLDEAAVPTLDVDLAWHTHQLSPKAYLEFVVQKTSIFIDHDDKVDDEKLGTAFEWTSKIYQEKYNEVYSECTCWYCETVRVQHISSVGKLFSTSKQEKFLENWHSSGAASQVPQPPKSESAHISAHPAVHTEESVGRRGHTRVPRLQFRNRLEDAYTKAQKKATKGFGKASVKGGDVKGRMGPRGEDVTEHWGKPVQVKGPFESAMFATTTAAMYATPPGLAHGGSGLPGNCASGTCGGSTGCGSGLVGMCAAGCTGGGKGFGQSAGCFGGWGV